MSTSNQTLPAGFRELQPFVGYWVRDSNEERRAARSTAQMGDIRDFYDAVTARAEEAISYLEQFPLNQMPADAERLFKLLLAMNHAAIAVEMHGQPRARDTGWPSAVHITRGPTPHGNGI